MSYPPEWPAPGKMHFRLVNDRLGRLDLDCDHGYVLSAYNLGFPDIREVKLNNSLDDGVFDVTRFFGGRAVSLDVTLKPHTGLTPASQYVASEAYLRDRLIGYLYPGIRSRLLFSEHGDTRVRQMLIRGTSASLAVGQPDYNKVNVSWLAPRGTLYSYDERCYLYQFSETSGDYMDLVIVNEGTVPVDWRASISGYSVHPRFILNGTEMLRLEYEADPGDVITLDSFSRTITINGVPASYAYIDDDAVWFKIPPGFNTLRVAHLSGISAFGYPYARWQPPISAGITDLFERAGPTLGANWVDLAALPDDTVDVPLEIDAGEVIVTIADDGTAPHAWGFAQNVAVLTGGGGLATEVDVTNLVQPSFQGPTARSKVELYTNMNDTDVACQALHVDFDYGVMADPVAPLLVQDPFETLNNWVVAGSGASLVPTGRNGGALRVSGSTTSVSYNFADDAATVIIVGVAVQVYSNSTVPPARTLFEVRGNDGTTLHGKVAVDATGTISGYDANGVAKAVSPAAALVPNTWCYVEARYVLDNLIGECTLRVDGVDVATAFDIDTNGGGTGFYDQVRFPTGTILYDDFYLATGADAEPLGAVNVPNGSLAWSMHQYSPGGTAATPVASGTLPFNYDATAVRLRLESGAGGEQRFLLNGAPVAAEVEETPVVGTLAGFGASWETFEYPDTTLGFTDEFERAALGTDWVLPVPRTTGSTTILPTIATGAAVGTYHSPSTPNRYNTANSSGTSLAGGVTPAMPASTTIAGYMVLARVLQDNPRGTPITASTGWTQLGAARQGTDPGEFMEAFDNFAAWLVAGAVTNVAGRTGTGGARITGVGTSNHADYVLPTANAQVVVGFAHQISSLVAATSEIVQFYGDANTTQHNRLTVATNGSLSFWRGTTNLGTSAAGVIAINTWNYIEVSTTLSDTVGAVTVRVNGTAVLTLTAQDTQNAGTATVYDTIRLMGPIASMFNTFDDLYVMTGAAAFKGNQTIAASSGTEFIRMSVFARVCDGTSLDQITLTGAASPYVLEMETYRTTAAAYTPAAIAQIKFAMTTGATGYPDPPSITLGTTAKDWLFHVSGGIDAQGSASMSGSTGYSTIYGTNNAPGNVAAMRTGERTGSQAGTEDPAAYAGSTTNRPWIAYTMALPGGGLKWNSAERTTHEFDAAGTISVEALVHTVATNGLPVVELYSHMVAGLPTCRVLQVDLFGRTWKVGHYDGTDLVVAGSGSLPAGALPFTIRLEGDPGGTDRFLFNGTLVSTVVDATAPTPTGPTHVGFGEFWNSLAATPQVRSFTAEGIAPPIGPPPAEPTSPRIERFAAWPMSGSDWAIPDRPGGPTTPPNNPPPGGKPPWAWTPPIDPLTGEPSILTVHFCFFDQWL